MKAKMSSKKSMGKKMAAKSVEKAAEGNNMEGMRQTYKQTGMVEGVPNNRGPRGGY